MSKFYRSRTAAAPQVRDANAAGDNSQYATIEPGYYTARVVSAKEGSFRHGFKGQRGTFNYSKITPDFVLMNEAGTRINRQDVVMGVVDDEGFLYRPDGDDSKPALFSDAGFLLGAMGFKDADNMVDVGQFSSDLVMGQIITVKVANERYEARDGSTKTKNKIEGFYPLNDAKIEDLQLVGENGMWFETDEQFNSFLEARERLMEDAEYDDEENI